MASFFATNKRESISLFKFPLLGNFQVIEYPILFRSMFEEFMHLFFFSFLLSSFLLVGVEGCLFSPIIFLLILFVYSSSTRVLDEYFPSFSSSTSPLFYANSSFMSSFGYKTWCIVISFRSYILAVDSTSLYKGF